MKKEDHVTQLSVSLILQVTVVLMLSSILGHAYPVNEYLLADLFLSLSLLPVIAAIRRGPMAAKACGLLLAVMPLFYIYLSVQVKGPICIQEWFKS